VVDLTHDVPVHDVRAGALALWRVVPWLDRCVVLALVDPVGGHGTPSVAIEVGGHRAGGDRAGGGSVFLVGPDNGLLNPALHRMGGAGQAVRIPGGGGTFNGRDVLAPAAARLAAGVGLGSLGRPFDPAELVGGPLVPVRAEGPGPSDDGVVVEVWGVDRFGNVQLGLVPDGLGPGPFTVEVLDAPVTGPGGGAPATGSSAPGASSAAPAERPGSHTAVLAASYGELPPGVLGVIPDADGLVSLSLARAPAAPALGAVPGVHLRLRGPGA
jgi:hypothetical protein